MESSKSVNNFLNSSVSKLSNISRRANSKIHNTENEEDETDTFNDDAKGYETISNALRLNEIYSKIHSFLFPGLPEHYPLKKKLLMAKSISTFGSLWDFSQVFMSLFSCAMYVSELYDSSYDAVYIYGEAELIITQFFLVDFCFNWFVCHNTIKFFLDPLTIIDILTIIPVYINLADSSSGNQRTNFSIFRFIRILRLIRILKSFRLLSGLSGVKRQVITIMLSLSSLIFLATGIVQIMENDIIQQLYLNCQFVNAETSWLPSCLETNTTFYDESCDCAASACEASYTRNDLNGEPSLIKCNLRSFFVCFYYIIVTISTVGYGDYSPTHDFSRIATIVFIATSMILIPIQINQLNELLAMKAAFREPYVPTTDSTHIIICGYVNNRLKLERFAREFFHPDRTLAQDVKAVILMPSDPNDDVKDMLLTPDLESKIFILIGSPLNANDLVRARADTASAIFFLCNSEIDEITAKLEDELTVLCTLSVSNFNPNLECLVQMINAGDRDVLKDSNLDVLICLDELKSIIQARNSICHGFSTLVELLFMSFGTVETQQGRWFLEYIEGAGVELYYVPINLEFLSALQYEWTLIVEGIYLEYESVLIGVCNVKDHKVILNPNKSDFDKFPSITEFYKYYNIGVIVADEQSMASAVGAETSDFNVIERIIKRIISAEKVFTCRIKEIKENKKNNLANRKSTMRKPTFEITGRKTAAEEFLQNIEKVNIDDIIQSASSCILNIKKIRDHSMSLVEDDSDESEDSFIKTVTAQFEEEYTGVPSRTSTSKRRKKNKESDSDSDSISQNEKDKEKSDDDSSDAFDAFLNRVRAMSDGSSTEPDRNSDIGFENLLKVTNEVEHADSLRNHVIVTGSVANLNVFLLELRKPVVIEMAFHPVLIVSPTVPPDWENLASKFYHVYFLRGDMMKSKYFNRSNIKSAYSFVLRTERKESIKEEGRDEKDINLDAESLFIFMKLERYIPTNVFFTVELVVASNIAVINSTVIKKYSSLAKHSDLMERKGLLADQSNPMPDQSSSNETKSVKNNEQKNNKDDHDHSYLSLTQHHFLSTRSPEIRDEDTPPDTIYKNNEVNYIETRAERENENNRSSFLKRKKPSFWDVSNSHHVLPVFASGKAFVPSTFDTLLCQSFFTNLTPLLCEAIVRGQNTQSIFLIPLPESFANRTYGDLFRALNSRNVLPFGLYRASCVEDESLLPFVCTSPKPSTILRLEDRVYVYGNPTIIKACVAELKKPLVAGQTEVISWFLSSSVQ